MEDAGEWRDVLRDCTRHDVYHTPEYHTVAESQQGGRARLFVMRRGGQVCALPFLIQEVRGLPWLRDVTCSDGTSVYGYGGPVCSLQGADPALAMEFGNSLRATLREQGIISLFCRLHPLIESEWLLTDVGQVVRQGTTVSIPLDTASTVDEFAAMMSTSHRYDVRRLRSAGVVVEEDVQFSMLAEFIAAYHQTMRRNQASQWYFFDVQYFESLRAALGDRLRLFVARSAAGEFMSATLTFICGDIMQYHLAGTPDQFRRDSASKLNLAELAVWGAQRGFRHFHLGGGLGASDEDGLFRFKQGFSSRTHAFRVFRLVVLQKVYDDLCELRRQALGMIRDHPAQPYFPLYRAPAAAN